MNEFFIVFIVSCDFGVLYILFSAALLRFLVFCARIAFASTVQVFVVQGRRRRRRRKMDSLWSKYDTVTIHKR